MSTLQFKLILLVGSIPNNDIERFTPYVTGAPGSRGPVRSEEAREWLERRRYEAIAALTLAVATIAMLAAIVAAVRC
jgi:hypothetical protein